MYNYESNIPDIYDLYDFNRKKIDIFPSDFIKIIKITNISNKFNIKLNKNNDKEENFIINEECIDFRKILDCLNRCSYYVITHLLFRITNNKANHKIKYSIDNYLDLYDNLLLNDVSIWNIKICPDKTINDTIIIYCTAVEYHLTPYKFFNYYTENIYFESYTKYITIFLNDLYDYDYNIMNVPLEVKVNNIDVRFKCKISDKKIDLIFISINNIPTSFIIGKNCLACKRYNDFKNMPTFKKLIQNNRNNYDENLNQIMPNILDCDEHFYHNQTIFDYIKEKYINIVDILEKINIYTKETKFKIIYNFTSNFNSSNII